MRSRCLAQTKFWQVAQLHDEQDPKPYVAYIRVLRRLDENLETRVMEWVTECMEVAQFPHLPNVLQTILRNIRTRWASLQPDNMVGPQMLKDWCPDFLSQPLAQQWLNLEASGSSPLLERRTSRQTRRTLSDRLSRSNLESPVMPAVQTNTLDEDADFAAFVAGLPDLPDDNASAPHQHDGAEQQMEGVGIHELDSRPQMTQTWATVPHQHGMQQTWAQSAGQLSTPYFTDVDSDAQAGPSSDYAAVQPPWDKYASGMQLSLRHHGFTEADVGQLLFQLQQVRSCC